MQPHFVGTTAGPEHWPQAPSPWSVSVLTQIKECPRRWALATAAYPSLWSGHGYPRLLPPSAIAGQVVHASIRRVASALAKGGCTSACDPGAASVLRCIGGLTSILHEEHERILERERDNPRVHDTIDRYRDEFTREIPALRQHVQEQVRRIPLTPRSGGANGDGSHTEVLRDGSHHELRVRSLGLDFVGVLDLLTIAHGRCAIWEFKTGEVSDRHIEQLQVYALLWAEDDRNPTHEAPEELVLSYEHHTYHVPSLSHDDIRALRADLRQRILDATTAVSQDPPPARPAPVHCAHCDVRQLCPEYWSGLSTWKDGSLPPWWRDVEVRVGNPRGPRTWDAVLVRSQGVTSPSPIVLVHGAPGVNHRVSSGLQVRLLGVRLSVVDGITLVTMTTATQVFVLP